MDKLLLFRGEPYKITNLVTVENPTVGMIADYGEEKYWQVVMQLCATSFDYRLPLEEDGIDYLTVDDWQMFLYRYLTFDYEETKILIPNIDMSKLKPYKNSESGEIILGNDNGDIVINAYVYYEAIEFIRNCHCLQRNYKIPGNKAAREVYMRDARDARMYSGRQKFKSTLSPLVSALCNSEGFKYNFDTVWDLPIYAFFDATRRISKIHSVNHFSNGVYSGNLDLSKMSKAQMNKNMDWMGELD